MISAIELMDSLHQPCLIIEVTALHIRFVNRAFASTIGSTPRKILRNYKRLSDLFPLSSEFLVETVKEASKIGIESNGPELVEEIEGHYLAFVPRSIVAEDNTIIIVLNNLTVERKLQEKYAILLRSLTAYSERMRSDLEFKDFIVDRLPKLLTADLTIASRMLLEIKEDMVRREDANGILRVKALAGSLDQISYVSKNVSQLRSPYGVERKDFKVSELDKHLKNFFKRSFDPGINSVVVNSLSTEANELCSIDPNLLSFSLRNLFSFLQNKAMEADKTSHLLLKLSQKNERTLLEFTGTVETLSGKAREKNSGREMGLELLVANKLARAMGGHISFSSGSSLSFQLVIPALGNFVLHKKKPFFERIFCHGYISSLPQGLKEFLDHENLHLNQYNFTDDTILGTQSALIIPAGTLSKNLILKLARFNGSSIQIIPIVRHDTYDQLLQAFEELDVTKFLLEPLTVDALRSVFFNESDSSGFTFSDKY